MTSARSIAGSWVENEQSTASPHLFFAVLDVFHAAQVAQNLLDLGDAQPLLSAGMLLPEHEEFLGADGAVGEQTHVGTHGEEPSAKKMSRDRSEHTGERRREGEGKEKKKKKEKKTSVLVCSPSRAKQFRDGGSQSPLTS